MLSLIDPTNCPTSAKSLKKMSDIAAVNRKEWYTTLVNEVNNQKTFAQVAEPETEPGSDDAGDLHL
eukprot:2454719-Amphidinium_carterae.1